MLICFRQLLVNNIFEFFWHCQTLVIHSP